MRTCILLSGLLATSACMAQCSAGNTSICSAALDPNTIVVNDAQSLAGAYQCFHVTTGADLQYDGAYSLFLVESGGTLNVNGVNNLVLAKNGATVGFCGSGYNNTVKHESGVNLNCMEGDNAGVCAEVVFIGASGIGREQVLPFARFDAVARALLLGPGAHDLSVFDLSGRSVLQRAGASGMVALHELKVGTYLARLTAPHTDQVIRFVLH